MKRVDDFRLKFGKHELVPIMIGGMGVDISTADLALEIAPWAEWGIFQMRCCLP
jgi:nitronate monooxygenase